MDTTLQKNQFRSVRILYTLYSVLFLRVWYTQYDRVCMTYDRGGSVLVAHIVDVGPVLIGGERWRTLPCPWRLPPRPRPWLCSPRPELMAFIVSRPISRSTAP
jgi:hypothetical protein